MGTPSSSASHEAPSVQRECSGVWKFFSKDPRLTSVLLGRSEGERQCSPARRRETVQSRQTERDSAEGERQCSPARRRETVQSATESAVQRERDSAVRH